MKKSTISTIFLPLFLLVCGRLQAADELLPIKELLVFYAPSCHKCIQIKDKLLPQLGKDFSGRLQIEERDISDVENYKLLLALKEKYDPRLEIVVPVFYCEGNFLGGRQVNAQSLRRLAAKCGVGPQTLGSLPAVDLAGRFRAFKPLAVAGAGLIDGINPCAFTVIVFFITYLALQGYRKKEMAAVGAAFILAVFLTYLLLGLGIFNFLYYLKGFWLAAKIVNISIGILAIGLGLAAVYDIFKFKKSGSSEGFILQLPQSVKNKIHYVIGRHYRKGQAVAPAGAFLIRSVAGAFSCGFMVSLLEAVCTGQTYLPTISFILKTSPLKAQALIYLVFYNLMFILPLAAIFVLALFGVTSGDFSRFLKKNLIVVKLLMAVLFFGLGIFLLWRYNG